MEGGKGGNVFVAKKNIRRLIGPHVLTREVSRALQSGPAFRLEGSYTCSTVGGVAEQPNTAIHYHLHMDGTTPPSSRLQHS